MRTRRERWRSVGAVLAAAAGLLGGSPPAVQAPPQPAPAPSCRAEPDPAEAAAVAALVEELKRLPPRRAPDGEPVETLDNRGYAYGAAPSPFEGLPTPLDR
jgi:hypothetical protein